MGHRIQKTKAGQALLAKARKVNVGLAEASALPREHLIWVARQLGAQLGATATKAQAIAAVRSRGHVPPGAPVLKGKKPVPKKTARAKRTRVSAKKKAERKASAELNALARDFRAWRGSSSDGWRLFEACKELSALEVAKILRKEGIPASSSAPKVRLVRALYLLKGAWADGAKVYVLPYVKSASKKARIQRQFHKKHARDAANKAKAERMVEAEKSIHKRKRRSREVGARSRR